MLLDRGPVGIFVLRVWTESAEPETLRIRIVSTRDAASGETRTHALASANDACRVLETWLADFRRGARRAGDVRVTDAETPR